MNYPDLDLSFKVCLPGPPLLMHKHMHVHHTMNILFERTLNKSRKYSRGCERETQRSEAEDAIGRERAKIRRLMYNNDTISCRRMQHMMDPCGK